MATQSEKLANSLKELRRLQKTNRRVFQSSEFSRTHRERLENAGYLGKIINGWMMSTSPGVSPGDSTPWISCFWEFCGRYCTARFGKSWHLSPDTSLQVHSQSMKIPAQVIVHATKGQNNLLELPFETKLIAIKSKVVLSDIETISQLRMLKHPVALAGVLESYYTSQPKEARIALSMVRDASALLPVLLSTGRTKIAGRLAGAFRHIGREDVADEILEAMRDSGHMVTEKNPFHGQPEGGTWVRPKSPIAARIKELWTASREEILETMPEAPGLPADKDSYLAEVEEAYAEDAYHSLSIEGFHVSDDLIERVASGDWDPESVEDDKNRASALACRGYLECFERVKESLGKVLEGDMAGPAVRKDHRRWYRALFAPHVRAGLLDSALLSGYRSGPVYIKNSRHVPVNPAVVDDAMEALFDCLESEDHPAVAAVLGHWMFGYIHPYSDGNGRMARFLMNVMLASGGFPWTTIRVEDRGEYMDALEQASVEGNPHSFAQFVIDRMP